MIRTCQRRIAAFALGFVALVSATIAEARECEPRPALHAHHITGKAYGNHDLIVDVVPGLRLAVCRNSSKRGKSSPLSKP